MRKIYFLFTLFIGLGVLNAQTPILTAIGDGDCTGGTPKFVEIYADGTVDFSLYSLERMANGGAWGATVSLADFGTITDDFVYVYVENTNTGVFASEFPSAVHTMENNVVNINGDDGIRIVNAGTTTVVDQFGEDGVDGTGEVWEYLDGYAKRINGTGPDGTFNPANWEYNNGGFDNGGLCQGGDSFESMMGGIQTYTPSGGTTEPGLFISSPANGATLPLGTTSVSVSFIANNFSIGNPGDGVDGHVHYTLNGGSVVMHYSTEDIELTDLDSGSHTIDMWLVDNSHQALDPNVSASVTFSIPGVNNVANIAELRAGATDGSIYTLTGEAVLTMQQNFRGQKYIQDATGAILIDDVNGVIESSYDRYDGITGVSGTLGEFNGILQLIPVSDPGAASSTGNSIVPVVISIDELNNNLDAYESQIVQIEYVQTEATGVWETGQNYDFGSNGDTFIVRTNFYDADYIGDNIPAETVHLVGVAAEFNGESQLFPRDSDDIITNLSVLDPSIDASKVKVATVNNTLYITGFDAKQIAIYNVNGQLVSNSKHIGNLTAGTYIAVMVNADGQKVNVKFMKK